MARIHVYIRFAGNCREAMTFYKECLGGELFLLTVGDSPLADQMPAEARESILHSTLANGALVLKASDMAWGHMSKGPSLSLMLECGSEEEINRFFSALSAGGEVSDSLSVKFWGSTFGGETDKYGNNWMLTYDNSTPER